MTILIILIFSSFFNETSFNYRNYILTGNVSSEINLWEKKFMFSSIWNGKKNLLSNSNEEDLYFISTFDLNYINFFANLYRLKNNTSNNFFSLRRECLAFKKKIFFLGFVCNEEFGAEFEKYFSEINENNITYNNGMVFNSNIYKNHKYFNFSINQIFKKKTKTSKYYHYANISFSIPSVYINLSGKINNEYFPLTNEKSFYHKYEITSDGYWDIFKNKIICINTFWFIKYYKDNYNNNSFSKRDLFFEEGIKADINFSLLKINSQYVYGFDSLTGFNNNEKIKTDKITFSINYGLNKLIFDLNTFMSIFRIYKYELSNNRDYDIANNGLNSQIKYYFTNFLKTNLRFLYRSNQITYISKYYSGNNVTHKTYLISTTTNLKLFDLFIIDQFSQIKSDYTFFQYFREKNILYRTYENSLSFAFPISHNFSTIFITNLKLKESGGFSTINNSSTWYFLRNQITQSYKMKIELNYKSILHTISTYYSYENNRTHRVNGMEILYLESYNTNQSIGLNLNYLLEDTEINININKNFYSNKDNLWDIKFFLSYQF